MSVTLLKGVAVIETKDGTQAYEEAADHHVVIFRSWGKAPVFHRQEWRPDVKWLERKTDCGLPLYWGTTGGPGAWGENGTWIAIRMLNHALVRPCRRCWP